MKAAMVLIVAGAACSSGARGGPPANLPAAAGVDTAVVATAAGLVAVTLDGAAPRALADGPVSWCAVDDRAQVVWFASPEPDAETYALRWLDLREPGAPRTAVRGVASGASEVIIDHGAGGQLGGEDPVAYFVGVRLTVAAAPTVGVAIGCDGDAGVYCYDTESWTGDAEPRLIEEYEGYRQAVAALTVADPAGVAALAARSDGRTLWSPTPAATPLPRVTAVPVDGCTEMPERCGEATALPGTPYQTVVTSNSRGDFFHESQQLYDPARREFFLASDPTARSPRPLDGGDVEGLLVAPSGRGLAVAGRVVSFERGVVWQAEDARACGWIGGGWRVGGPRE